VPPHPGIVGAVSALGGAAPGTVMVQTILFGALMGIPIVLVGWFGPGRWWAARHFVGVPERLVAKSDAATQRDGDTVKEGDAAVAAAPSFAVAVLIVTLPLIQSLLGFGATLLNDLGHLPAWMAQAPVEASQLPFWLKFLKYPPLEWLRFLGHPTMALLVPTGLAFLLLGARRGMGRDQLAKLAESSLIDVGAMAFLFGAAGGFKQVIQDSGAGDYIAGQVMQLKVSPVLVAYLVAVLMRVALGSATASILTASALLAGLAKSLPGQETLLVLAVANGVTFMTQPADSGFWLVKEYVNLDVRDVMTRFNLCRITMSVTGLLLLLAYEALRG
jgi:H+/gluconate symporter-like permease